MGALRDLENSVEDEVNSAFNEMIDDLKKDISKRFNLITCDEVKDLISDRTTEIDFNEIADSNVPTYNSDIIECALDDLWLATDAPEVLAFDGRCTAINSIAGNLYEHLYGKATEKWNELVESFDPADYNIQCDIEKDE